MKIRMDNNSIVIYINKAIIKDYKYGIDEKSILDILLKTSKIYSITFIGLYTVRVYQNKRLGVVLEISKYDDLDMIDYTDFRIKIYNNYPFLLEFSDYFDISDKYIPIYYDDKYYLEINKINEKDLLLYSELYEIKYKDIKTILNN